MTRAATRILDSIKTGSSTTWSVAARTGLSQNTVRRVVNELRKAGLVQNIGTTGFGREVTFSATVQPTA